MATNFKNKIGEIGRLPLFVALAFKNGLEYQNTVNSTFDRNTSCSNLIRFGPVTPEFTKLECIYQ